MHFLNPIILWALPAVLPLAVIVGWWAWRRKQQLQQYYGEEQLVTRYSKPLRKEAYQFKTLWIIFGLAALVVALARPSIENGSTEFPMGSVDVVAIVDVSRSMAATDYKGKIPGQYFTGGTRLDMARYLIINDIISSLKNNRLGVVTFAGKPFPQAFLTQDMPALEFVLGSNHSVPHAMTISSAPGEGSALAPAVEVALKYFALDSDSSHRRVIVLFSDGGNDSDPAELTKAIDECKQQGIEVIIAGLGSTDEVAIPVNQLSPQDQASQGDNEFYTENGEVAKTALDENMLHWIANRTGGRYIRVNKASDFHVGYLVGHTTIIHHKGEQELFSYPLMVALFFMMLALITPMEPKEPEAKKPDSKPRSRR